MQGYSPPSLPSGCEAKERDRFHQTPLLVSGCTGRDHGTLSTHFIYVLGYVSPEPVN